jgi:hypothetical protein
MENLEKVEGKYYTQNVDELPIEERVFFTQGKVANVNDFRFATEEEISTWREYEDKLNNEISDYEVTE